MRWTIEYCDNGYLVRVPPEDDESLERIVLFEKIDNISEELSEFTAFKKLVDFLSDELGVYNSKHKTYAFAYGVCSEDVRYEVTSKMGESLDNPRSSYEY